MSRRCSGCTAQLLASGKCRYKCDPALKRPGMRGKTQRGVKVKPEQGTYLKVNEARGGYEKVDPRYGDQLSAERERARRGWNRRKGWR